jgi:16S rRNA processing protein RimM
MKDKRQMILMGAIAGVHGVRGEVKVKSFTSDPLAITAYGPLFDESGRKFDLKLSQKAAKDTVVVARIEGVSDRNAAEALKGKRLYAPREALPAIEDANEFYASDLIGLSVEDRHGKTLGKVVDLQDYGAGAIIAVSGGPNGDFELPFADRFVPVVDLAQAKVIVELPDDFFTAPSRDEEEGEESPSPESGEGRGGGTNEERGGD